MRLIDVLKSIEFSAKSNIDQIHIEKVVSDSRLVKNGDLFIAISGVNKDGHEYISDAVRRGAKAIMAGKEIDRADIPVITVKDERRAAAMAAANFYGHPSDVVKVVGVTGTNGKTTITYLLEGVLKAAGHKTGIIGTIEYRIGDEVLESCNTTPSPITLQDLLRRMRDRSIQYCAMEVSSHALDQYRVGCIDFDGAIFTNATPEHLDYHKTFENYVETKARLFSHLKKDSVAIINRDEPNYPFIRTRCSTEKVITYGIGKEADVRAEKIAVTAEGSTFVIRYKDEETHVSSRLIGIYNIYNMLSAACYAIEKGIGLDVIKKGLENVISIPGRLERLDGPAGIKVFVDYAHTDDALEKVLSALQGLKTKRIITVFGCGGNRDKTKRPRMGKVATRLSDYVIITSDNPRFEDPNDIVKDVLSGIDKYSDKYEVFVDRKEAIEKAVSYAREGDFILLAGKGHEKYQIIKDEKIPSDDLKIATKCLLSKGKR